MNPSQTPPTLEGVAATVGQLLIALTGLPGEKDGGLAGDVFRLRASSEQHVKDHETERREQSDRRRAIYDGLRDTDRRSVTARAWSRAAAWVAGIALLGVATVGGWVVVGG